MKEYSGGAYPDAWPVLPVQLSNEEYFTARAEAAPRLVWSKVKCPDDGQKRQKQMWQTRCFQFDMIKPETPVLAHTTWGQK